MIYLLSEFQELFCDDALLNLNLPPHFVLLLLISKTEAVPFNCYMTIHYMYWLIGLKVLSALIQIKSQD